VKSGRLTVADLWSSYCYAYESEEGQKDLYIGR